MAIKGTLEAFTFSTLELVTVDERRALRKELQEKTISLATLDVDKVHKLTAPFFLIDVELVLLEHLETLLMQFNTLMAHINAAASQHPNWYETCNFQRLHRTLNDIAPALKMNKDALTGLLDKQQSIPIKMQIFLNKLREDASKTNKMAVGREVFQLLCDVAGAQDGINPQSKINEAQVNHSEDLAKRFGEGYIYHWTLDEEIQHIPFEHIFKKIPEQEKEYFAQITKLLDEIAKTTKAVYSLNWKHVALLRRMYCLFFELGFKE